MLTQKFPSGDLFPIRRRALNVALHGTAQLHSLRLKLLEGLIIGLVASRAEVDDAPLQGCGQWTVNLEGEVEMDWGEERCRVLLEGDVGDGDGLCCHCG